MENFIEHRNKYSFDYYALNLDTPNKKILSNAARETICKSKSLQKLPIVGKNSQQEPQFLYP